MIIPLGRDTFHGEAYMLCLSTPVSLQTILARAKVRKDTYAGDLISNLYEGIFERSLELKSDYLRYFEKEYDSVVKYLRKRFLMGKKTAEDIAKEWETCSHIFRFCPSYCFLEEDYGKEFLAKLLEARTVT